MKSFGEFSHDLQEKNVPNNPELWKKAIAKAKAKFDVYPSAYANAWASKWYKGEGGTWSTKKEEVEIDESTPAYRKMMKDYAKSDDKKVFDILDKNGYRLGEQGDTLVRNMLKKFKGDVKKAAAEIMKKYPGMKKEDVELDENRDFAAKKFMNALMKANIIGVYDNLSGTMRVTKRNLAKAQSIGKKLKVDKDGVSIDIIKEDVDEGFASDAQRRAAFASGYKAKGKKGKKEEVEVHEEDEDKKPLMTWFAQFEKELKKSGGKYKDIDPTDMLKLYYKGIKPKVAAKQLTASYTFDKEKGEYVRMDEASFADRMIVKQGRSPGSGIARSTNIGLVLPKTASMEKKIKAVMEKDAAMRRKMANLVVGREDREKEFVLYFKSAQGRKNFRQMMDS